MNILEKKETKIIAVAVMVILIIIAGIMLFNKNNLKQTKNSLEHEAGQELVFDAQDYFDVDEESAAEIAFDVSKVDVNTVGEYQVTATYENKAYTIKVNVVDTTAPIVKMSHRYIFTNDVAAADISGLFESVYDVSEYASKLVRFERSGDLSVMNEKALNTLVDAINTHASDDELKAVGSTDIPTEPGIYRSIVEVKDASGNAAYEEVYIILDTTGASINEVEDQVVTVQKDMLSAQPELDKTLYKALDNVDGSLTADDLNLEVVVRDEAKHEWIVKVSYTDRAGNESADEFLITVKEETASNADSSNDKSATSDKNNSSNKNNSSDKNNTSDKNTTTTDKNNTSNSTTQYDPMDTNKDGWVSESEEMSYVTPNKQKCIDAGYGVVVEMDGGEWYGCLMKSGDHTIDGRDGGDILYDYLTERGLEGQIYGSYISSEKEWYFWTATDIREREVDIEF